MKIFTCDQHHVIISTFLYLAAQHLRPKKCFQFFALVCFAT